MPSLQLFLTLLRKEFVIEFRQRYAISGIVLYVFSMVFVVYIASIKVQPQVWNILFWLIVLFASINAVVKSFVQESGTRPHMIEIKDLFQEEYFREKYLLYIPR